VSENVRDAADSQYREADAIDFPQAYKAIAILMRSISLPSDEVKRLLELVDVYGEPKITPTDKLSKAFAQLDDEAAKA
jgi:translation initiation factor 4G